MDVELDKDHQRNLKNVYKTQIDLLDHDLSDVFVSLAQLSKRAKLHLLSMTLRCLRNQTPLIQGS